MIGTLHIIVAMKPLDGTFAENALKHGVAGLNIDGTRVNPGEFVSGGGNSMANHGGKFGGGADYKGFRPKVESHNKGRFPANVILGHLEGCARAGMKKVKGITGGTGNHDGRVYGKRTNQGEQVKDYADSDGTEMVEAWKCQEGCPVKAMDEQSGVLKSGKASKEGHKRSKGNMEKGSGIYGGGRGIAGTSSTNDAGTLYGDTGGASRFFFQVNEFKEQS